MTEPDDPALALAREICADIAQMSRQLICRMDRMEKRLDEMHLDCVAALKALQWDRT